MSTCSDKACPHRRAFEFALQYFSTEDNADKQTPAALVKRYRESLRRQRVEDFGADDAS